MVWHDNDNRVRNCLANTVIWPHVVYTDFCNLYLYPTMLEGSWSREALPNKMLL